MLVNDEEGKRGRRRVRFLTEIEVESAGKSATYKRTHDVSMNGVFVSTARPLPIGTKGKFTLVLSAGMRKEKISGTYEVVRHVPIDEGLSDPDQGGGMGLKFVEIDPEGSELLFQVIQYNQPE
ncbi:MAG: PilZ domain-containing protein [Nitrospinae bacterium]|nr:PilZ domain-containing protein [Nitrospinota bacterium]